MSAEGTIASVGPSLPLAVLAATGRYAGPLGWDVARDLPFAATWLESKFAPWAASILEDWAAGALDGHAAVVFSRADDNAQRLYYTVCELQRQGLIAGPEPLMCDIALGPRATSRDHTIAAVRRLAARLDVRDEALEGAILAGDAVPHPARPATSCCLIAGTPPADRRLHAAVAAAGWHPAGDTLAEQWGDGGAPIDAGSADPCAAIGAALHARGAGNRGFGDPAATLRARIEADGARAAVLWFAEDDESRIWHIPAQRRLLADLAIPALVLTRQRWGADNGEDAAIADFLREIRP